MGTPDYFHRCNNSLGGVVGVPDNLYGSQEAFEGDGYIGIGLASWNSSGVYEDFEYASTTLKESLKSCFEYKFSMFISMSEYSSYAVRRIGVLLTSNEININSISPIVATPQFYNNTDYLVDSTNWTKIEGSFIASGGERFLTIGYFFDNVNNDTFFVRGDFFGSNSIYYFIDSINLFEVGHNAAVNCSFDIIQFPNVITPNGDGKNDLMSVQSYITRIAKLDIINRWGNLVVTLDEFNPFWDGQDCPDGVYFYIIYFREEKKKQTGFIHLVR